MAVNIIGLLKQYIKKHHKEQLEQVGSKQSKVNIDFEILNQFLLNETGKDFFALKAYKFLDRIDESFNIGNTPKNHISFKIINVPCTVQLHDLDATHNKEWVSFKAMIKNITDIRVDLKQAVYECHECGEPNVIHIKDGITVVKPTQCKYCGGSNLELLKDSSIYRDYKYLKLEEPLELRNGGATREIKAYIQDYLASPYHNLKAGDVCDVTGEFRVEPRKNQGKMEGFEFIVDVHNIAPVDDAFEDYSLTETDKSMIIELSKRQDIYQLLVDSLAPEIYGHNTIKEGLLLQLFEGQRPLDDVFKSDTMDRWTIHILLIGDPGVGKSQLISAVNKRAPKVISIAGTNTSQAGLTTSAVKDELTGTWTMEAGAVVLGDTGLLCIDEYDKLKPSAQKSLNEPMEQLSVSSAKAGLVQTMSARTSILAAANPKYSRFNPYKTTREQLDIAESNLSRFDLIFVLEDKIDKDTDVNLAKSLLDNKFDKNTGELLSDECFKKYITYMKAHCFPVLSEEAKQLLISFYVDTRQAALANADGKPITARDLKALERLTIARAKCECRNVATAEDANNSIRIYSEALKTIGLVPETAGDLELVRSSKELEVLIDVEKMIRAKAQFEGVPLSAEDISGLRMECRKLCKERGLDHKGVFDDAYENVRNALYGEM